MQRSRPASSPLRRRQRRTHLAPARLAARQPTGPACCAAATAASPRPVSVSRTIPPPSPVAGGGRPAAAAAAAAAAEAAAEAAAAYQLVPNALVKCPLVNSSVHLGTRPWALVRTELFTTKTLRKRLPAARSPRPSLARWPPANEPAERWSPGAANGRTASCALRLPRRSWAQDESPPHHPCRSARVSNLWSKRGVTLAPPALPLV